LKLSLLNVVVEVQRDQRLWFPSRAVESSRFRSPGEPSLASSCALAKVLKELIDGQYEWLLHSQVSSYCCSPLPTVRHSS